MLTWKFFRKILNVLKKTYMVDVKYIYRIINEERSQLLVFSFLVFLDVNSW